MDCVRNFEIFGKEGEPSMIKVGDKVRIVEDIWFEKGEIVEVREIDRSSDDMPYYCSNGEHNFWIDREEFELIREEIHMFKVGDKVEITDSCNSWYGYTGKVVNIKSGLAGPVYKVTLDIGYGVRWISIHNLKAADDQPLPFKEGDHALIYGDPDGRDGSIVKIVSTDCSYDTLYPYYVEGEDGNHYWVEARHLSPVSGDPMLKVLKEQDRTIQELLDRVSALEKYRDREERRKLFDGI
jgi:hypothetical protein